VYAFTYVQFQGRGSIMVEKTMAITSARQELMKLSKYVAAHMDRIVLTNKGVGEAVLLSLSEYRSLKAAAELAQHPRIVAAMNVGFAELADENYSTLEDAFPPPASIAVSTARVDKTRGSRQARPRVAAPLRSK
jgi:prevent-host-death family protein